MATLPLITAPHPLLKSISTPVAEVDQSLKEFLQDMVETMYADGGVGLAAVQVGITKQLIVLDLKEDDDTERIPGFYPLYLINPCIVEKSDEYNTAVEGCLSVPTLRIEVPRPQFIKVNYINYHGKIQSIETGGWLARVIQHEIDHLHGRLIIDYLSGLKKELALGKLKKLKKIVGNKL